MISIREVDGSIQQLGLEQAYGLLAKKDHSEIHLAIVRDLAKENWFGEKSAFIAEAIRRNGRFLPHPEGGENDWTIEDYYHSLVNQKSKQMTGPPAEEHQYNEMEQLIGDLEKDLDVDMDEIKKVQDHGIGTSRLATCVAVGMSGKLGESRFTVMTHWSMTDDPEDFFSDLESRFDGANNWPNLGQLQDLKYVVVGGSRQSVKSQTELLDFMIKAGRTNASVALVNDPGLRHRSKIAVITSTGQVKYGISTTDEQG